MSRRRLRIIGLGMVALFAGALAVGGCGQPDDNGTAAGAAQDGTASPPSTDAADPSEPPVAPPADEPTATDGDHRVTYDWAVPSEQVTIAHQAAAPTPYLVAIYAGDHPEVEPPYQRVSFYFREGFPEYNLQYVRSVEGEGTGTPISLEGNAFLRVGFVNAQAHDDSGATTITRAPEETIGFQNLKSYGSAGDFEGHVTYGLGLQVAPDSDQILPVRAGELEKPDGEGGVFYVVYVDVQSG